MKIKASEAVPGQWYEENGRILLCVLNDPVEGTRVVGHYDIIASGLHGDEGITHLPDCTGWDWQPPKPVIPTPPEGYRLKQDGDKKDRHSMVWVEQESAWRLANYQLPTWDASRIYAVPVEPEKRYRAFASMQEWWPHRERWVRSVQLTAKVCFCIQSAKELFEDGAIFVNDDGSDGEPFGVEVSE